MDKKAIRKWREARGWNLTEAAQALGVDRSTFSKWESGDRTNPLLPLAIAYLDSKLSESVAA